MLVDRLGNAHAAGLGKGLQACRHVHAIAVDIVLIGDHVGQIDADPHAHLQRFGDLGIPLIGGRLDIDREMHGVHDAGKLRQEAVAHLLDEASAMAGQQRRDIEIVPCLELAQRSVFVNAHQPGIAGDVGGQNSCQAPFHSMNLLEKVLE